ncbi:MAG: BatD family protein, partial [Methanothrix sp.]
MGLIYIMVFALLAISMMLAPMASAASEDETEYSEMITRDFSFRVGEGVRIGDYRVELTNVVSVMDGLIEVKAWKRASQFEDWRVMESRRDVNLDGGQDRGGLTLMVTEIFDRDTVRMRATYRSDYGYPEKYITERAMAPRSLPKLEVSTGVDKSTVRSGEEVKVTITVRNIGNDTARDVALQELPPLPQFRYIAGYPPKIKNQLQPGESDMAIYSMVAVTEGEVTIPATGVRYADSKGTI